MNDLPPDPARLNAILAHLDQQVTDNDTVGIYLRLQRNAVREALARVEGGTPPQHEERPAPAAPAPRRRRPSKPFLLERQRTADGPLPVAVHTADCHMAGGLAQAVNAMEARLAITDAQLKICEFCRPELALGFDAD